MYHDAINEVLNTAERQANFLKGNPLGYLLSAMLSGIFISMSVILSAAVWVLNKNSPAVELLSAAMVPLGLITVVFAGTVLFTGNAFTITFGAFKKKISSSDWAKVMLMVFIGNWIGTLIIGLIFRAAGHLQGELAAYYLSIFSAKLDLNFWQLIARAFLCNILVCAAMWACHRIKSDVGKFLIIFFCLLAFLGVGFENSIANMSQGFITLLAPDGLQAVDVGNYLYIVFSSALGNFLAGVLVFALPVWLFSRKTKTELDAKNP